MMKRQLQISVALAALLATGNAVAQENIPPAETAVTDVILVTSERREASLQDVPVAVSAYTAERRERLGIITTQDIARATPGMSYSEFPNRIFLRGVGRFLNTPGSDPGVATYSDGFYSSEASIIGLSSMFVDRVEVLRGPQGTLYGRNSIGGAVNVVSRRPSDQFEAELRQTFGNYNTSITEAAISGPVTDRVRFRLAASQNSHDGYIENDSGADQAESDVLYYEAQLDFDITDNLDIWVKYSGSRTDSTPNTGIQVDPYETGTYFGGTSLLPSPTFGYATANPAATDPRQVSLDYDGRLLLDNQHTVTTIATLDLGGTQLRYTGGWQTYDYFQDSDADRSSRDSYAAFGVGPIVQAGRVETIIEEKEFSSHELNLSSTGDGPMQWMTGLYYYEETQQQSYDLSSPNQAQLGTILNSFTLAPTGVANPALNYVDLSAELESTSVAAFGQVDYDLTPEWRLTAGLRYTSDEKTGSESLQYVLWAPYVAASLGYGPFSPIVEGAFATCCSIDSSPSATGQGPVTRDVSGEWDGWTGRVGLQWRPNDDTMVYGNLSRGYKSGGFNLYAFTPAVDEEQLTSYEIGLKQTFGSTLQINAAAFLYQYQDLQIPVQVLSGPVVRANFINADEARSLGFEIEAIWAPTNNLEFHASYSSLQAEFTDFCCALDLANAGVGEQDLDGATLPQSPEHKFNLTALYRFDLEPGSLSLVGSYSYVDDQYFSPFNTERYLAPSNEQIDLRAIWSGANGDYDIVGYVRNATDEIAYNGLELGAADTGFARRVTVNPPRTYGIELRLRY
jgi:iron complex outermembrane receptor protein